jgi:hypothetical protein
MESMLWRRLDAPGHDACRLIQRPDGWQLEGAAVFQHEGSPAFLAYEVICDGEWRTRFGVVRGWIGTREIDYGISRGPIGVWRLNGEIVHDPEREPGVSRVVPLSSCVDLDFGFTPATNVTQLRRVALGVRQTVDVPVAWLDVTEGTLSVLHQRYERRSASSYWYEAPRFEYSALLRVNAAGFVEKYPNLWKSD